MRKQVVQVKAIEVPTISCQGCLTEWQDPVVKAETEVQLGNIEVRFCLSCTIVLESKLRQRLAAKADALCNEIVGNERS